MPSKIHHIALEVADAAKSEAFYCGLLGFKKVGEHYFADRGRRIVFLDLDGVCIELLADEGCEAYEEPPAKKLGYKHLALLTDDVKGDCEKVRAAGFKIRLEPVDTALGSRICYVEDPDGLPVELWQNL